MKKRQPYRLTLVNLILIGLVILFFIARFLIFGEKSAEGFGYMIGSIVGFLMFAFLASLFFWFITGRDVKSGSLAFNITILLVGLSQFSLYGKKLGKKDQLVDEIMSTREDYLDAMNTGDSTDYNYYDSISRSYVKSVSDKVSELEKQSTNEVERKTYKVLGEFTKERQERYNNWADALALVNDTRILDYSILKRENEYEYQIETLDEYILQTHSYIEFYMNSVTTLTARLEPIGLQHDIVKGTLKGAREQHNKQKDIMDSYLKAHIRYGEVMKDVVNLLNDNQEWIYENEEVIIQDEEIDNRFYELMDGLELAENDINRLSDELTNSF